MRICINKEVIDVEQFESFDELIGQINDKYPNIDCSEIKIYDVMPKASMAEQVMWASSRVKDNSNIYNINFALTFESDFDINIFREAINMVVSDNVLLRSSYVFVDGELFRKTNSHICVEPEYKIDCEATDDVKKFLRNVVDDDTEMFDLAIAPLFKVKVYGFKDGKTVVFFSFHHIIFDGPSVKFFVDQLIRCYSQFGKEHDILGEDEELNKWCMITNGLNKEESDYSDGDLFWKNTLMDVDSNFIFPKNEIEGEAGYWTNQLELMLSEDLSYHLKEFCKQYAISPFILFLSVYGILLSKYSNRDTVLIGVPVTVREDERIRNQIGCFINTIVLKIDLWGNPTFREVIYRVKNSVMTAMEYHDYPISRLYEVLKLSRNATDLPLFQIAFSYLSSPFFEYKIDDITVKVLDVPSRDSMYDLFFEIVKYDNSFQLKYQFNRNVITNYFVKTMGKHYSNILEQVISDVDLDIETCEYMSDDEINQIINGFNEKINDIEYVNLYSILQKTCETNKNKIAINYKNEYMTYGELLELVDDIAGYLYSQGLRKGDKVGILLKRSPMLAATLFAFKKIGLAYIPLENSIPPKRMEYYMNNACANVIVVDDNVDYEWMNNIEVIDLRKMSNSVFEQFDEVNNDKQTLAHICYTSGTTGNPKGIIASEENVNTFYNGILKSMDIDKFDNWIFMCSLSFDPHVLELIIPLVRGKNVTIVPDDAYYDVSKIRGILSENKIDFIHITPTKAELIFRGIDSKALSTVKAIAFGAEPLTKKMLNLLNELSYSGEVMNIYGPTETCLYATICRNVSNTNPISVGKPIEGYNIYIMDDNDNVVPIGIPGQICISGNSVSKGYFNNPQLTNEVFIDNPFDNNYRMYKTGDIGKWDETGNIVLFGRKDNQIKIRGNRVEIEEIEVSIEKLEYVEQAKVLLDSNEKNETELRAYIKFNLGFIRSNNIEDSSVEQIRKDLSENLPNYMIPTNYVIVDEFPMTISGKIDIKKLHSLTGTVVKREYIEPKTDKEKLLYSVFSEVLQISQISVLDNFFSLGGESMKAMQVIAELEEKGYSVEYKDFFLNPTIESLAKLIQKMDKLHNEVAISEKQSNILAMLK